MQSGLRNVLGNKASQRCFGQAKKVEYRFIGKQKPEEKISLQKSPDTSVPLWFPALPVKMKEYSGTHK
jgi:hypothetical protein